ncbi:hypothetical protein U1Q18_028209 [Sarracenia purpurea var. burkii]
MDVGSESKKKIVEIYREGKGQRFLSFFAIIYLCNRKERWIFEIGSGCSDQFQRSFFHGGLLSDPDRERKEKKRNRSLMSSGGGGDTSSMPRSGGDESSCCKKVQWMINLICGFLRFCVFCKSDLPLRTDSKSPRMCGDAAAIGVPTGEKRWSDGGVVVAEGEVPC